MLTNISGFPELLPHQQKVFDNMVANITELFEMYGFNSMNTSAVERVDTLLAKGDDNEIYGIHRLAGDASENKMALRFDLTVPLARYIAQNHGRLFFPFRRYQIGPVWRGERAQSGRYRQFYQCDVDIITAQNAPSVYHDIELIHLMQKVFHSIEIENIVIRMNHRAILQKCIEFLQIDDVNGAMRMIDKLGKVSVESVMNEIIQRYNISEDKCAFLRSFLSERRNYDEWMNFLRASVFRGDESNEALLAIETIFDNVHNDVGQYLRFDPLLARGLTYYTSTVYEVVLAEHPNLGSVCGGGSYANLAESLCNRAFPGVGVSFGITRIMSIMTEKILQSDRVLIVNEGGNQAQIISISEYLRNYGIKVETYLNDAPLKKQLKYASHLGFILVIMCDDGGQFRVKDMRSGEQHTVLLDDLVQHIEVQFSKNGA